jgi:hypothetical protein
LMPTVAASRGHLLRWISKGGLVTLPGVDVVCKSNLTPRRSCATVVKQACWRELPERLGKVSHRLTVVPSLAYQRGRRAGRRARPGRGLGRRQVGARRRFQDAVSEVPAQGRAEADAGATTCAPRRGWSRSGPATTQPRRCGLDPQLVEVPPQARYPTATRLQITAGSGRSRQQPHEAVDRRPEKADDTELKIAACRFGSAPRR